MGIYPKRPKGVIEVESDDLRQGKAVIEGFGGGDGVGDDGWCEGRRLGFLT